MGVKKNAYPVPVFGEFYPHLNVLTKAGIEFNVPVGELKAFG